MLDEVDSLLMGRTTYDLMKSFWPTAQGQAHSPQIAERMNRHTKYVASHRALDREWPPARRLDGDLVKAVADLKSQPGKDIAVLGSRSLFGQLAHSAMIDELRITLNPVVLGAGPLLFAVHTAPLDLALVANRPLDDGAILLVYGRRDGS
jgi:dihydrofolate reductase